MAERGVIHRKYFSCPTIAENQEIDFVWPKNHSQDSSGKRSLGNLLSAIRLVGNLLLLISSTNLVGNGQEIGMSKRPVLTRRTLGNKVFLYEPTAWQEFGNRAIWPTKNRAKLEQRASHNVIHIERFQQRFVIEKGSLEMLSASSP